MPTLWSKTLIPTLRQVPAEAEVPSHQLMLRAGLIRKLGAGVYDYLPLGYRSLRKAMEIVRREMEAAGAVEVFLPSLQPIELWEQTGRRAAYGENLFLVKDRHGRLQALGPTHEEVVTELAGAYIESYKQLPLTLYQIQTKFRDEFRPRFGVLRSREFQMKDAYSFHLRLEGPGGLDEVYQTQYDAYGRIFRRCGLSYVTVEAESGPIGGSASHEFMVPSPTGEDTILESDQGNYAANVQKCATGARPYVSTFAGGTLPEQPPKAELTDIHTPGCPGIDDVCAFFKKNLGSKLKTSNMLKTLVIGATSTGDGAPAVKPYLAVVRGDHDLNLAKLQTVIRERWPQAGAAPRVDLLELDTARTLGFAIGFVGPQLAATFPGGIGLVVDPDAALDQFWVTGANQVDHHVKGFHWKRDVLDPLGPAAADRVVVADIRNAVEGDPSPKNDGGVLHVRKGIEIGHVFKLGDRYTKALNITVLNEKNERQHPIMGCYGIGINRILAAALEHESGHDADGIIWPVAIAPYAVLITVIQYQGQAKTTAETLAAQLEAAGLDVLIDDRDERPGVKFKDADLIGIPVRITIGEKALANAQVEVKARKTGSQVELVAIGQAAARVQQLLQTV
jgi:prolyl-tRNA synthetase